MSRSIVTPTTSRRKRNEWGASSTYLLGGFGQLSTCNLEAKDGRIVDTGDDGHQRIEVVQFAQMLIVVFSIC